jgi:hypothetical protein
MACLLPDTGARNVDSLLNQQILPVLSQQLLSHMAAKQKPSSLQLTWDDEEGIVLEFDTGRRRAVMSDSLINQATSVVQQLRAVTVPG